MKHAAFEKLLPTLPLKAKFEQKPINPYRRVTMSRTGLDYYVSIVDEKTKLSFNGYITLLEPKLELALNVLGDEARILHDCPTPAHWIQHACGGGTTTHDARDGEFTFNHATRQAKELKRTLGDEAFNLLVFGTKVAPEPMPKPLRGDVEKMPKPIVIKHGARQGGKTAAVKAEVSKARAAGKKVITDVTIETTAEVVNVEPLPIVKAPITEEEAKQIALEAEADAIGADDDAPGSYHNPLPAGAPLPPGVLPPDPDAQHHHLMSEPSPPGVPLQQQGIAGNSPARRETIVHTMTEIGSPNKLKIADGVIIEVVKPTKPPDTPAPTDSIPDFF